MRRGVWRRVGWRHVWQHDAIRCCRPRPQQLIAPTRPTAPTCNNQVDAPRPVPQRPQPLEQPLIRHDLPGAPRERPHDEIEPVQRPGLRDPPPVPLDARAVDGVWDELEAAASGDGGAARRDGGRAEGAVAVRREEEDLVAAGREGGGHLEVDQHVGALAEGVEEQAARRRRAVGGEGGRRQRLRRGAAGGGLLLGALGLSRARACAGKEHEGRGRQQHEPGAPHHAAACPIERFTLQTMLRGRLRVRRRFQQAAWQKRRIQQPER
jgi:hypothetical protein